MRNTGRRPAGKAFLKALAEMRARERAQAIEARRAETENTGSVEDESAVRAAADVPKTRVYPMTNPPSDILEALARRCEEAEAEIVRLNERLGFWMRNAERLREKATLNHDCYLMLWADHGGPELPERLRALAAKDKGNE